MPRRARLSLPNIPLHIIRRGNNRQACFYTDEDYLFYLNWLREHADKTGCRVHAVEVRKFMVGADGKITTTPAPLNDLCYYLASWRLGVLASWRLGGSTDFYGIIP